MISKADEILVKSWLHGRSPNTASAYRLDATRFLTFLDKPLADATLGDLQSYAVSLDGLAHASRSRKLASAKSLLRHAVEMDVITKNPASALRTAKLTETSGDHILTKQEVKRMMGAEPDVRRRLLIDLIYSLGLRASEACGLRWRDVACSGKRDGEAKILGKGSKLRTVLLPLELWRELAALTPNARPDMPVIPSFDGGDLNRQAVHRAVKRAARRAGLGPEVSAHWLRHSHATHALADGALIHVVQQSLGHASIATTQRYLHVGKGEGSASFIKR